MNYCLNNFPWPHIVADDYYDIHKFNLMKYELSTYFRNKKSLERQLYTTRDSNFNKDFPLTLACLDSKNPKEVLQKFVLHRDYKSLNLYHEISFVANNFQYPIHDESENKILSIVTYVSPLKSKGTFLYDKNKNFVKEVEWKRNRSLIFAGITNLTWHNYKAELNSTRITINTFLTK